MTGTLYLIPNLLGESTPERVLPAFNTKIINNIRYYIVENIRTTRRFLKRVDKNIDIDRLTFFELNQHTDPQIIGSYIEPLLHGEDMGIVSEAGCPAVADPGALVVELAQQKNIQVVPLVGPSSILLALMASGFNGQSFSFEGYLPIDNDKRIKRLKVLENRIYTENQTQIFIETPYRNNKIVQDFISHCRPSTKLCIASEITTDNEFIKTKTLGRWKNTCPDLSRKPTIFLLYK
ncbi:MAG: SAM-dependent methyltransferase [Paludibacteraceae bacterium]